MTGMLRHQTSKLKTNSFTVLNQGMSIGRLQHIYEVIRLLQDVDIEHTPVANLEYTFYALVFLKRI